MRTTLNIDNDVFDGLQTYSKSRSVALGKAASELIRKALTSPVQLKMEDGFYAVVLPEGSRKVTSAQVKQLLEDEV
jgi:hypothetical protein